MDPTGGATAVAVASLSKWSLSMATDKVDVTCFGDANKIYVVGLADVKGSLDGFWDKTDRTLFDVALGGKPATLKLIPCTDDPTYLFTGQAYVDSSIDVSATGAVTIKGDFVAAGDWTMEPVGP
jgi:hypothetical protein